jgi:hypothetical protein
LSSEFSRVVSLIVQLRDGGICSALIGYALENILKRDLSGYPCIMGGAVDAGR